MAARPASAIPGRSPSRSARRSTTRTWSRSACFRGNRNFEGRVSPDCRANYLASPPLVVAYALKGTVRVRHGQRADRHRHQRRARVPQGHLADQRGSPRAGRRPRPFGHVPQPLCRRLSRRRTLARDRGHRQRDLQLAGRFDLHPEPALLHRHDDDRRRRPGTSTARGRWRFSANSITTDHISPAGAIKPDSPAGRYLLEHGVSRGEFNSYGARRGNHEVMMRGTFANIRIRNRMLDNVEGGFTRYAPTGEVMPIYDAAMLYKHDNRPLVVIAGKEYGTGSSRDWAAKGTVLLGVRAVIAESFERIHRSNLVGMGVLPLQFDDGENAASLGLDRRREILDHRRCRAASRGRMSRSSSGARTAANSPSPPAAGSIPITSSNISARAESSTTCFGGWQPDRHRDRGRSRRLGRRGADPAGLSADHGGQARPAIAAPIRR